LDYEKELLASLQRLPSEMGLTMLQRIANAEITVIQGQTIESILKTMLLNPKLHELLKDDVEEFLEEI